MYYYNQYDKKKTTTSQDPYWCGFLYQLLVFNLDELLCARGNCDKGV